MKVAFAISVYNKLHELGILTDIIRQNFGSDAYINVICNNTEYSLDRFDEFEIDDVQIEANIELNIDKNLAGSGIPRYLLHLRILDQFTQGMKRCAQNSSAGYTVHLHADAWPLTRGGIEAVINEIEKHNALLGVRGYGFSYGPNAQCPDGHVQEMFFFASNHAILGTNVFDYNYADLLFLKPNIHGMVASLMKYRLGATLVHWYSDLRETLGWDGRPKRLAPHSAMAPLNFDPSRGFLHLDRNVFLDEDGFYFMSKYLTENDLVQGDHISKHLESYPHNPRLVEEHGQKLAKRFNHVVKDRQEMYDSHPVHLATRAERFRSGERGEKSAAVKAKRVLKNLARYSIVTLTEKLGIRELLRQLLVTNGQRPQQSHPHLQIYKKNIEFLREVSRQLSANRMFVGVIEYDVSNKNLRHSGASSQYVSDPISSAE